MSKELLSCPFCGCKPAIIVCDDEGNIRDSEYEKNPWSGLGYVLFHINNHCPVSISGPGEYCFIYDTKQEAIEAWNKREERTCKPISKPNIWGFSNYYCECGNKLLEVANGLGECLPNYCKNCGSKIVE